MIVLHRVYKIPREEIADKLSGILRFRGTNGENAATLIHALQIYSASNISIVDAVIIATALENARRVRTFDRALLKRAKP